MVGHCLTHWASRWLSGGGKRLLWPQARLPLTSWVGWNDMPLAIPISDGESGIIRGNLDLEKIEPVWEEIAWGLGICSLWDSSKHTRGGDLHT